MKKRMFKISIILTSVVLSGLLSSCQSLSRSELDQVRDLALQAQRSAETAETLAKEARSIADEARSDASNALSAAQDASTCCAENTQRIERMFETLQQK